MGHDFLNLPLEIRFKSIAHKVDVETGDLSV